MAAQGGCQSRRLNRSGEQDDRIEHDTSSAGPIDPAWNRGARGPGLAFGALQTVKASGLAPASAIFYEGFMRGRYRAQDANGARTLFGPGKQDRRKIRRITLLF